MIGKPESWKAAKILGACVPMTSFRLDRFLTLYFFTPFRKLGYSKSGIQIPVLMYHSISNSRMHGVHPYYETTTSPRIFRSHMEYLHQNDYQVIDLHDMARYFAGTYDSTKKPIVISFDDGLKDFYTEAFPILRQYQFSASMFLPTGFIENSRLTFKGKECLSWERVRELKSNGITFGSHTKNHPKLYGMKESAIEYELQNSKERIDKEIGKPTASFSYPYAFPEQDKHFVDRLRHMLKRSGYTIGVTTRIGVASEQEDRFFLKRLPINSFDDLPFFKAKLSGAYDWIFYFQRAQKKIKHMSVFR